MNVISCHFGQVIEGFYSPIYTSINVRTIQLRIKCIILVSTDYECDSWHSTHLNCNDQSLASRICKLSKNIDKKKKRKKKTINRIKSSWPTTKLSKLFKVNPTSLIVSSYWCHYYIHAYFVFEHLTRLAW